MGINASDVWISRVDGARGNQGASPLSNDSAAPDVFEDVEHIRDHVREHYRVGEYRILLSETTVEVEPRHEMHAEYSETDLDKVRESAHKLQDREDIKRVTIVDDPTGREALFEVEGARVRLDPLDHDIVAEAILDGRDIEQVVRELDWLVPDVRLLGWQQTVHHARRGARGQDAVEVVFKRDTEPLAPVKSAADAHESIRAVLPSTAVTYIPLVSLGENSEEASAVAFTNQHISLDTPISPSEDERAHIVETVEQVCGEFIEEVSETVDGWKVISIGVVPSRLPEGDVIAFGLRNDN